MVRYRLIADVLRERVLSGAYVVGQALPGADQLAREFGVGRDTALKAVRLLRNEGIAVLGRDCVVRAGPMQRRNGVGPVPPANLVEVPPCGVVRARMPTPRERAELDLPEGVPVLVVRIGDVEEVHPADETGLRFRRDQTDR
ncbi:GntR family transcriptional regulator [Dactylosporangium sp. CA-233914]|uniref:GntR family transcriptional regulator n=1 Tax=Dactylosporangium sp. CA-233914 TaxID=3239934 RepID=UPI003D8D7464